ncbi:MAG: class I mannose-6-phosphate isomerase [Thermomicrobiales bacterium]|nr:class I mannose-6-phosphate isomerase [Thermomicrobiales bacterium]
MTMPRNVRTTTPLPILVQPIFDPKPWGSRRLGALCGDLPEGLIGEALLTAPEAVARSGPEAGQTLGDLAATAPHHWCGERGLRATHGRAIFPLLAKLIDATDTLSVQVHPDDAMAAARGLGTGKTEAWHMLDAAPGAVVYAGLRDGVDVAEFRAACLRVDEVAGYLNAVPAHAGMTVIIPAGTVHAIGGGVLLYEIQQPSNVTFRLNDWGRRDAAGVPRTLHHEDGFVALHAASAPRPVPPLRLTDDRVVLAATEPFALEQVVAPLGRALTLPAVASPQVLTVLEGVIEVALRGVGGAVVASTGQTLIVPAAALATLVAGRRATLLRGWAPDLEADIVRPARDAGISRAELADMALVDAAALA